MATNLPLDPEADRHVPPLPTGLDGQEPASDDDDDSDASMVENDDGSVTVLGDKEPDREDGDFYENLAERLEDSEMSRMAVDLLDLISRDREARKERDDQYAEGIRRTGLGGEAPGGADFDGASTAVHPGLTEGCIDFAARAMKEIFPAAGPVKSQIIGEATEAKTEKAGRKATYMNWQFTKQIKEYRSELEQLLTQLPLGGSQYLKIWYDERFERPRAEFISIDDIYLPYSVTDFYTAHRKTHKQLLTRQVFQGRIRSGLYRDVSGSDSSSSMPDPDKSESSEATDMIEGKSDLSYNEDGLRTIYEIYVDYEVPDDPLATEDGASYIITIDEPTRQVLAVYRNWDEEDSKKCPEPLDWMVEFKFVPWKGAYGIGLPHIVGSLAGASTGALRALLDSAHISNMPTALKMKGMRASGQTLPMNPAEITEIEGPTGIDDIRKLIMPVPFNGPSPVLMDLLNWCTDHAKGVVSTAEEKIGDASNNMPVGTTLALIEQGSVVFSAIHSRLHASQAKAMEILHRINRDTLDDEVTVDELGSLVVSRQDFTGPMDVIPVSDPNIFSEAQRYAQLQAVQQLAAQNPGLYKADELNKRALALLKFPDPNGVLNVPPEPQRLDPTSENFAASEGKRPLKVYTDQDHHAHLQAHLHFALSPIFCANQLMAVPALPALISHCREHLMEYYRQHTKAATAAVAAVAKLGADSEKTMLMGQGLADQKMAEELAPLMQLLQQAQQAAQQFVPPPPPPPEVAAQIQMNKDTMAAKSAHDQAKLAAETQVQQAAQALKEQTAQAELSLKQQAQAAEDVALKMGLMQEKQKDDADRQQEMLASSQALAAERQDALIKANTEQVMAEMQRRQDLAIEQMRLKSEQEISTFKALTGAASDQQTALGQSNLTQLFETIQQAAASIQSKPKPKRALAYSPDGTLIGVHETDHTGQTRFRKASRDANGNLVGLDD